MHINQISSTGTSSASNSLTASQAAAAANPISAGITKSATKLQTQLDTATANLSTLGKFKASVSMVQDSAKNLTSLKDSGTSDEVKKALTTFVSDFNSLVASTQAPATDTSGVDTISRSMTRAMTADFSRIGALQQMGLTKASDGSLQLDTDKFEAALNASPTDVQSTLAKLGQMVDKIATKELVGDGRISNSMSALSSKSSTLQQQQNALQKAAQPYASLPSSSVNSALSAYQSAG